MTDNEKRSILIIDDDALLCASLVDAFADSHTEVSYAHTGADGIASCRERRVDVVLLDQHLPDTTGETLCPEILSLHDRAKVVFMTAYPTFDNVFGLGTVPYTWAGYCPLHPSLGWVLSPTPVLTFANEDPAHIS